MKKNKSIAIIPAREGSKRIKKKNKKRFLNKPIILRALETALKSKCFDKIYVSTDSKKISKIASTKGVEIPYLRPKNLSGDYVTTLSVINHMIKFLLKRGEKFDYVCCIYPTAVFFRTKHLKSAFKTIKNKGLDYVFTATEFVHPIEKSFTIKNNKIKIPMKKKYFLTRTNKMKKKYHDAGQFYFGKTKSFLKKKPIFDKNSKIIKLKKGCVVDINDNSDWFLAENIFKTFKSF